MPPRVTGPGSAARIPVLMRAVILGLHWHGGLTFKQIEAKVEVKERTASEIVKRAKVWASEQGNKYNFKATDFTNMRIKTR